MPIPYEVALETVEMVNTALRQGARPPDTNGNGYAAIGLAAQWAIERGEIGSIQGFRDRLSVSKAQHGLTPDWTLYTPARYVQPRPRQVIIPAATPDHAAFIPQGEPVRALIIGDMHQDPRHPDRLEVMKWTARLGSEHKFERVIQPGDWGSFDSVSRHDKNDTYKGKLKPFIQDDLDNIEQSLQVWNQNRASDWKPKQDMLFGNHENRLYAFENSNPETVGMFTGKLKELFAQYHWRTRDYGEIMFVNGVAISHHPTNAMGKAFGGKTGAQRAANDMTCSFIGGHTHKYQLHSCPKIGMTDCVQVLEVGCALPHGTIEDYALHSMTGWWWGVVEVLLWGGQIMEAKQHSMLGLRSKYSD